MFKLIQTCMIIFLSLNSVTETEARNFASSADLEMLLETEEKVLKTLYNYVKAEKKRLNFLDKYLARLKKEYEIAIKDVEYYFGNPINAYTIIKRLGPDLEFAENILRNKTDLKTPNAVFPTDEDMRNSVLGVMSMLSVYKLNISQLANGILNATASPSHEVYTEIVTPMTASDCYSMGMTLYLLKQYHDATLWLQEAYKKVEEVHCDICPVSIIDVVEHICQAYHEIGDLTNFIKWSEILLGLRPDHPQSAIQAKYIDGLRFKDNFDPPELVVKKEANSVPSVKRAHNLNFTNICIGRTKMNHISKSMSCYYAHGPHPVLTLAPLKAERLHRDPDLTMFYDVLSDDDIQAIQTISKPKMWNTTRSDLQDFRNAEFINLPDDVSEAVARASRRALHLSGLSAEDSETLKVINYGIGGFYRQHWDTRPTKPRETDWDRAGTIIYYLSDVEQGGATVFPLLDLAVFPKKGAAVFWMNQFPSGAVDLWLMHAACPVLRGDKWIAVKWPHQYIKRNWCPVWTTDDGVVTSEMYKKIVKDREHRYNKLVGKSMKNKPRTIQHG